jgi:hypothetical protein
MGDRRPARPADKVSFAESSAAKDACIPLLLFRKTFHQLNTDAMTAPLRATMAPTQSHSQ